MKQISYGSLVTPVRKYMHVSTPGTTQRRKLRQQHIALNNESKM